MAPSDLADESSLPAGPIPYDRHKAILEKARQDARAALLKEYPGLGQQVTPALYGNLTALSERLQRQGPMAFVNDLVAEMAASPEHADQLLAWGRQLFGQFGPSAQGQAAAQAAPEHESIPLPDSAEGYTVQGLSKLMQWFDRRIDQRLSPVRAETDAIRTQREAAQRRAHDERFATSVFGQLQKLPHFEEVKPELAKRFVQMNWPPNTPHATIEAALFRLYSEVLGETVLPGLTQTAQRDLKARLDTKARATTTSPTANGATHPATSAPQSFRDALADAMTRR